MPEPLTFVWSKSVGENPHSRVTARTCAANASLSSISSMSPSASLAASSAFPVAGTGPMPRHQPHQGAQPQLGGLPRTGEHADRGAVVLPDALPAVTVVSGSSRPRIGRSREPTALRTRPSRSSRPSPRPGSPAQGRLRRPHRLARHRRPGATRRADGGRRQRRSRQGRGWPPRRSRCSDYLRSAVARRVTGASSSNATTCTMVTTAISPSSDRS